MGLVNKIELEDGHELKQTNYREKGTMAQDEYWSYEETDSTGNKVATYEYWECTSLKPPFKTRKGYRKYDISGEQIEEKHF